MTTLIESVMGPVLVNTSEGRPGLHTVLRRAVGDKLSVYGVNIIPDVHKVLNQITAVDLKSSLPGTHRVGSGWR
ncbi:MAG: hypothetical protein MUW57_15770 [Pseudomonas sp.]|nr:hypothetical protein [Pseudomonas sp.]